MSWHVLKFAGLLLLTMPTTLNLRFFVQITNQGSDGQQKYWKTTSQTVILNCITWSHTDPRKQYNSICHPYTRQNTTPSPSPGPQRSSSQQYTILESFEAMKPATHSSKWRLYCDNKTFSSEIDEQQRIKHWCEEKNSEVTFLTLQIQPPSQYQHNATLS